MLLRLVAALRPGSSTGELKNGMMIKGQHLPAPSDCIIHPSATDNTLTLVRTFHVCGTNLVAWPLAIPLMII